MRKNSFVLALALMSLDNALTAVTNMPDTPETAEIKCNLQCAIEDIACVEKYLRQKGD